MLDKHGQYTILLSEGQAPQVMPVFETPRQVLDRYFERFDVVIEDENHCPWQVLFGNVLVFKSNEDGETLPLEPDDLERLAHLLNPIVFKRGETKNEKLGTVVRT